MIGFHANLECESDKRPYSFGFIHNNFIIGPPPLPRREWKAIETNPRRGKKMCSCGGGGWSGGRVVKSSEPANLATAALHLLHYATFPSSQNGAWILNSLFPAAWVFYYRSFPLTPLSCSRKYSPRRLLPMLMQERERHRVGVSSARKIKVDVLQVIYLHRGARQKPKIRLPARVSSWIILSFAKLQVRAYNFQTRSVLQWLCKLNYSLRKWSSLLFCDVGSSELITKAMHQIMEFH